MLSLDRGSPHSCGVGWGGHSYDGRNAGAAALYGTLRTFVFKVTGEEGEEQPQILVGFAVSVIFFF